MKSERGITLISLTVYVIVMAMVLGVVAIITTFFYQNIKEVGTDIDPMTEYTTFNNYFLDEVNHSKIKVLECKEDYIVFDNGVQYSYIAENKGIYRNQVKICSNIEQCNFSEKVENGKQAVEVSLKAGQKTRTIKYILKD